MLLKLATRNIRRSVRDYAIYFITLTLGVALFYAFNSIDGQQVMFDIESKAADTYFEFTKEFLAMFSIVIAAVMGLLVIYSNRFLIKRRKKEFGTYLLLGMRARNVSAIVLMETLIVGFFSLAIGILLGLGISQGMSFVTAYMLETTISKFQFVFSPTACGLTIFSFAVIFLVVALFNTISINRYKLITLLSADERNEKTSIRNPWVSFAAFVVSVGILIYAYEQLFESGMVALDDPRFIRATVCMLIGSLLFFWSLAGVVIGIITHVRAFYFKKLRMFTVRQIASKVNTAFLSIWAVCVMLFFSITTFSTGLGLVDIFTGNIKEANPYGASILANVWEGDPSEQVKPQDRYPETDNWDVAPKIASANPSAWDRIVEKTQQVEEYEYAPYTYGDLLTAAGEQIEGIEGAVNYVKNMGIDIVGISQVNALLEMTGKQPVSLQDNECIMLNNSDLSATYAENIVASNPVVPIEGNDLRFQPQILPLQLYNNAMLGTLLVVAVPDFVIDSYVANGGHPEYVFLNIDFKPGISEVEASEILDEQILGSLANNTTQAIVLPNSDQTDSSEILMWQYSAEYSRSYMIAQSGGLRMLITYLALYIGFIFLMTTATILAIQQLSDTTDSLGRYNLLSKLGCDRRALSRSLLAQVLLYFLLPLGLAVCHSACAITTLTETLYAEIAVNTFEPIMFSALLVVIIYGGYMLITYFVSRRILRTSLVA